MQLLVLFNYYVLQANRSESSTRIEGAGNNTIIVANSNNVKINFGLFEAFNLWGVL